MRETMTNPICGPPTRRLLARFPRPAPALPLTLLTACVALTPLLTAGSLSWIDLQDQTATRLVAEPEVGVDDPAEKSFSWGDVDKDGDVDLVVGRKEPWASTGKRTNVLFLNENGVLTDRTAEFATDSDVAGDQGFLTPTNDRDILLVDVDQDGWLDVITAAELSDGDPKHIGHPRVYVNQRTDGEGSWIGFRHEDARIPALLSYTGESGHNPRFLSVAAGDVTGDGYPDLWFSDHDLLSGAAPPGSDFNDKLLLNQGAANPGFFTDVTAEAFDGVVPGQGVPFPVSALGAAGAIADMNDDDANDIVKLTALSIPTYVGIAYNDPQDGFSSYDVVYQLAGYYVSVGDLNNDNRLDLIITDEGNDRYLLNQGNGGDDQAFFTSHAFSYVHDGTGGSAGDEGFGGDNVVADLNNDGWDDVLVTDISADIPGCGRRMHLFHNLGGDPGDVVTIQEETSGSMCQTFFGNPPSCLVAGVSASELTGVHDVAVFDIDGDGMKDLVLGRCAGLRVYANLPIQPAGGVPDGNVVPGSLLTAHREPNGRVTLDWDFSCSPGDIDYEVYEGVVGNFTSHVPVTCSTEGMTTATFAAGSDAAYFLVVPSTGEREGSYGVDSTGEPRTPSADRCLPYQTAACE